MTENTRRRAACRRYDADRQDFDSRNRLAKRRQERDRIESGLLAGIGWALLVILPVYAAVYGLWCLLGAAARGMGI